MEKKNKEVIFNLPDRFSYWKEVI